MGYPVPTDVPALTNQQRVNLHALQRYLDNLPRDYDRFDMTTYYGSEPILDDDGKVWEYDNGIMPSDIVTGHLPASPAEHECGTAACAIGHGPAAGVAPRRGDGSWDGYSERAFGLNCRDGAAGEYLFGVHNPNCPQKAAERIRHVLSLTTH